jgi:secondary thiamine-phosphate synthase enzyme
MATLKELDLTTHKRQEFRDITPLVEVIVERSDVRHGVCLLFCPHTTAGLTLSTRDSDDVLHDIGFGLDVISPARAEYRDSTSDSPASLKASLVGSSLTLLIQKRELLLGENQGIYLAEFDGPRQRNVLVKIISD